jgi:acyl-CoA synthetase (AMP-forming)/AMP-acid ligase II
MTKAVVLGSDADRGQRMLIPHMVDRLASTSPDRVFGMWPVASASYEAGYQSVTYAELGNMVNGLAWWLVENLGPGQDGQALAYVGPNDVRIPALVLAAIKAGCVVSKMKPKKIAHIAGIVELTNSCGPAISDVATEQRRGTPSTLRLTRVQNSHHSRAHTAACTPNHQYNQAAPFESADHSRVVPNQLCSIRV